MIRLSFTIDCHPGEAAINRSRAIIRGHYVKSATAKAFAKKAVAVVRSAHGDRPTMGACAVKIRAYWPRRRHLAGLDELALGDVDAPVKAVLDALEAGGVLEDDALVVRVDASKRLDRDAPRIEVEVWEVEL